tara:strand:- start:3196 stop:3387 length:192 start_codon:yes stop_codon:yes gene_type:complete
MTMTNIEKALTYFRNKGIGCVIDDGSLYVDAHSFEVQVSQSEIDWRADLYDEEYNNEGADTPS